MRVRHVAVEVAVVVAALAVDLVDWQGRQLLRNGQILPIWVVPAISVVIYPLLIFRQRRPGAVFAVHWFYSGFSAWVLPLHDPAAGLLVALHALSRRQDVRRSGVAFALCVVAFGVQSYVAAALARRGAFLENLGVLVLFYLVASACAWGLGILRRRADGRTRAAEGRRAEIAGAAVRDERARLARELHDIVAHAVTAIILQAAGARRTAADDPGQVGRALEVIESAGVQAMHELHRLLDLLRSDVQNDDHDDPDTTVALQPGLENLPELIRFSGSTGLDVDYAAHGRAGPLDRSVDLAAYRVIQESLTNASKHSGPTASVRIRCLWSPLRLTILVGNPLTRIGSGPDAVLDTAGFSSGRGLIGLTERVRLVGGMLEAGREGHEFVVRAELPVGEAR